MNTKGVINVIQSTSKVIPIQGNTPQMTSMVLHSRYAYYNTTLIKVSPTYFLQLLLLHVFSEYVYANIHYNALYYCRCETIR